VPRTDPMAGQLIRTLVVDESEQAYNEVTKTLRAIERSFFDLDWAQTYDAGLLWTERDAHDVYLINVRLAGGDGIELIREARRKGCRKPLIAVTDKANRTEDVAAMKAGASDYLPRSLLTPDMLERVMRYAIDRQRAEQRMIWLSRYDQLTGLANRSQFRERLVQAIARANQHERNVTLMTIDVDRFRDVNERVGQDSGDLVLCEIAHRISGAIGSGAILARVGSDEFAAMLEEAEDVERVGQIAADILERMKSSIRVAGTTVQSSASIGISIYPQDSATTEGLVRNAEEALDRAKRRGGDGFQFHSQSTTERVAMRQVLAHSLDGALQRKEFLLHYQPIVTCRGRHPRGVEALLRWQTDDMRLVTPREFMPVLAQSDAVHDVGAWVFSKALNDFSRMLPFAPPGIRLVINMTSAELTHPQLLPRMVRALHSHGVSPSLVQIDVSESSIVDNHDNLQQPIRDLKTLGVSLAIDDFGTAGASLAVLAGFPFDAIKLDASFSQNIAIDRRAAEVAGALIATGHALGMEVCAEGVQTREQLAVLQDRTCDSVVGFLFGGPMSADATSAWLKRVKLAAAGRR